MRERKSVSLTGIKSPSRAQLRTGKKWKLNNAMSGSPEVEDEGRGLSREWAEKEEHEECRWRMCFELGKGVRREKKRVWSETRVLN